MTVASLVKHLPKRRLPVCENLMEVAAHDQVADPPRASDIFDVVDDACSAVRRLESVIVAPPAIRSNNLPVYEAYRWFPDIDSRSPRDRDAMHRDPIVDLDARPHHHRRRRQNPEIQPRRRDPLKVRRVGKERERGPDRRRNQRFAMEVPQPARRRNLIRLRTFGVMSFNNHWVSLSGKNTFNKVKFASGERSCSRRENRAGGFEPRSKTGDRKCCRRRYRRG